MRKTTHQEGVALITALILLVIVGGIGIAVLRGSIVETGIVAALEVEQATFAVAESAAMDASAKINFYDLPQGGSETVDITTTDSRISVTVTARQDGLVPALNSSLRLFGIASFSINSVAGNESIGARSSVTSGVAQRIPIGQ